MKTENTIPQTDFTTIIPITKYDAKQFIGRIQSQIEILEMVNKKDEARHWQELSRQAHLLFGIAYNGTDTEVQLYIESEYNKEENGKV